MSLNTKEHPSLKNGAMLLAMAALTVAALAIMSCSTTPTAQKMDWYKKEG